MQESLMKQKQTMQNCVSEFNSFVSDEGRTSTKRCTSKGYLADLKSISGRDCSE